MFPDGVLYAVPFSFIPYFGLSSVVGEGDYPFFIDSETWPQNAKQSLRELRVFDSGHIF